MTKLKRLGVDVGGSHISASLIPGIAHEVQGLNLVRKDINAFDTAHNILSSIRDCINETLQGDTEVNVIGIAFPGPFNYEKGVSAIANVGGKFENAFGLHMVQALEEMMGLRNCHIQFSNDAHCFAQGAWQRYKLQGKNATFITLGTGFGSAFISEGVLLKGHPALGPSGAFYDKPFRNANTDDYFSTRWFLDEYHRRTGIKLPSVKQMVEANDSDTISIFNEFGNNLGLFLKNVFNRFTCKELVIGGNIAKAYPLFQQTLFQQLQPLLNDMSITFCDDTEECILTGAAIIAEREMKEEQPVDIESTRKAIQPLLPLTAPQAADGYDVFPFIQSGKTVYCGVESLVEKIAGENTVVLEGFSGVLWDSLRKKLHAALVAKGKRVFWYDVSVCLKSQEAIDMLVAGSLNGNDPVFGKKYEGELIDFFDQHSLDLLKPDAAADICIVYGTGAMLSKWPGPLIYADVPKNEIQYRMRAGSVHNLGSTELPGNPQMYKRFYFIDWPVLNKHKEQVLKNIDFIIDEQRITEITWMTGDDLRATLNMVLHQPFRARPWFEAGVWGGHWMKTNFKGLNENEVNYAWSFELITPENGIVLEGEGYLLEVSFDFLLFYDNAKLMGKAAARFGTEFPIRFDFLDTYVGDNLSIQCHPRPGYIKEHFGESFTQDETYYIMDCEPGANVYLGFQESINAAKFKEALINAQQTGDELPVENYVQKLDTEKHGLYLIPNGTIHASGKNNLVLEISSTPYIFTFKMYDWQRLDLNGQPRPINIEHAFNNLYFDRKGSYVQERLISKPVVAGEWEGGRKLQLPTHEEHFYTVDRYEFNDAVTIETNGHFNVCMLVEGEAADVCAGNKSFTFSYAETFVIPAGVTSYRVQNKGTARAFLVVAYMKDSCC